MHSSVCMERATTPVCASIQIYKRPVRRTHGERTRIIFRCGVDAQIFAAPCYWTAVFIPPPVCKQNTVILISIIYSRAACILRSLIIYRFGLARHAGLLIKVLQPGAPLICIFIIRRELRRVITRPACDYEPESASVFFSLSACMCARAVPAKLFSSFSTIVLWAVTKSAHGNDCARRVYVAERRWAAKSGGLLENWPLGVRRRIWHFVCANLLGVCA